MPTKTLFTFFVILSLVACGGEPTASSSTASSASSANESAPTMPTVAKKPPTNSASAHFANDIRTIGPAMTTGQKDMAAQLSELGETAAKNELLGYYTGDFGPNRITLILTQLQGGQLRGYSVCAGNFRPLEGSIQQQEDGNYQVALAEPGNDPYDGTFRFTLSTENQRLKGQWEPFRKAGNSAKRYQLNAQDFTYRTDVGEWPEASQRLLTEEDVWNYNSEELRLMRNEIYARHGYCFKMKDMRYHFEAQDWYMPVTTDIRADLTDLEVQNIELIYEYETYYEEYYDDFGR